MKAKIFTLIVIGIMLVCVSRSYSQNILTDGDFSTTEVIVPSNDTLLNVWSYGQNVDIDANPTVVDGVCNYYITPTGYTGYYAWEIQLLQIGFPLIQGHTYRLSFDVKADADRTFGVFLGENWGNWTDLLGYDRYIQNATTEWQTITLDFNAGCVFPMHKLSFEIGTNNSSMYFDNVMLVDLGFKPSVGIIGSTIGSWDTDVNMSTTDYVHYSVNDLSLTHGIMVFRQDDMWCNVWANSSFPTGIATLWGPVINVSNDGIYNVTFNRETGEYSFSCVDNCSSYIGMIGTAVPPDHNWDTDANMQTSDGITYMISGAEFTDGEAKFRQDDSWVTSWGGTGFPTGIASLNGPPIPVVAGTYTVTFKPGTGEYKFDFPSIGILGDLLPGWWYDDIDLQTTDGVTYTIADLPINGGGVKFRQDNEWVVNWGDWAFPAGYGWQDGPNIPVLPGTYNVTFNRVTGEYLFTATNCPEPGIICPSYISQGTDPGLCGANVFYPDVVAAPNCGGEGITITQTEGLPSGSFFPTGNTTNTFVLTTPSGGTASCSFNVYVNDIEPPVIENLTVSPTTIWPPDHKMVMVTVDYTARDNCGGTIYSDLWAWSNEPENDIGDGNKSGDIELVDGHHVRLRAERSGTEAGREYYLFAACWDELGNWNYQNIVVTVPHDMKSSGLKTTIKSAEVIPLNARIWPNPGDQYFNLDVESTSDESIDLYIHDSSGQLVSVLNVTGKSSYRFGDDLKPGIYLVTLRQGANVKTIKIVKE